MRRLMILATLAGCTGANDAAPDERCEPLLRDDMPEGSRALLLDERGYEFKYALPDGAVLRIWPGTRTPMEYSLDKDGARVAAWGCWPGGDLAFDCGPGDGLCTCYEAGQSWECPAGSNSWLTASGDAVEANGPYAKVTQ